MPVQLLRRNEIDNSWWEKKLANAAFPLMYASSWYLDIVSSGSWVALHCTDTGAVLPFAVKRRLGLFQQAYQPAFTQQLGMFSPDPEDRDPSRLLNAIPRNVILFSTHLNEYSKPPEKTRGIAVKLLNMVLPLDQSIEKMRRSYSRNIRRMLRKAEDTLTVSSTEDYHLVSDYFKKQMEPRLEMGTHNYNIINGVMKYALENKHGLILIARDENNNLQGFSFFIIGFNRIINLFGTSNVQTSAMQLILDEVIRRYTPGPYLLDFEGSEIPGVASFFRRFGSKERYYYRYDYSPVPGIARWVQQK